MRYTHLAAERGVRAAAAALAHAFATAGGVGEGVLEGPVPHLAVHWLRVALGAHCGGDGDGAAAVGAVRGSSDADDDGGSTADEDAAAAVAAGGAGGGAAASGCLVGSAEGSSVLASASEAKSGAATTLWSYKSWGGELEFEAEEGDGDDDDDYGGVEGGSGASKALLVKRNLLGVSGVGGRSIAQVATIEQAFALLAEAEAEVRLVGSVGLVHLRDGFWFAWGGLCTFQLTSPLAHRHHPPLNHPTSSFPLPATRHQRLSQGALSLTTKPMQSWAGCCSRGAAMMMICCRGTPSLLPRRTALLLSQRLLRSRGSWRVGTMSWQQRRRRLGLVMMRKCEVLRGGVGAGPALCILLPCTFLQYSC